MIGVGVTTYKRERCLSELIRSLNGHDRLVVVNDGPDYSPGSYDGADEVIVHSENQGVAKSKNDCMRCLMDMGCEHIFLADDDVLQIDRDLFKHYIDTAQGAGIFHLIYGHVENKKYNLVESGEVNGTRLDYFFMPLGCFLYIHRSVLEKVGLMDEGFYNIWEHVDLSLRIRKAGFVQQDKPWPDAYESHKYLKLRTWNIEDSTILSNEDHYLNKIEGDRRFFFKHNILPFGELLWQ